MNRPDTPNWQISISNPSIIVKDIEDIAQCIYTILSTIKGSDPLRPEFGSDMYLYIDKPMNVIQPMLVYEVYTAISTWEKRITLTGCNISGIDFDKKRIKIKGIVTGSAQQVALTINL